VFKEKALKAYQYGAIKAEKTIVSSDPARLSVALNYSLFMYDVMNDKEEAKNIAKHAIKVANKQLAYLKNKDEALDSETCIDLLESNLKDWEEEESNPEAQNTELTKTLNTVPSIKLFK
jgi:hypothetical protein